MSFVAVLGGSGRLGRHVVRKLLDDGHDVKALVHRSALEHSNAELTALVGDVHDARVIRELVRGASSVVSLLGSAQARVPDVCSAAMRNLVPAMREMNVDRIVATTGSAAREDREVGREHPYLLARRNALMEHMADLILDGEEQLRVLGASRLAWTCVRLPRMLPQARSAVLLSSEPPSPSTVAAYSPVADAIVKELLDPRWVRRAPFVHSE